MNLHRVIQQKRSVLVIHQKHRFQHVENLFLPPTISISNSKQSFDWKLLQFRSVELQNLYVVGFG